MKSSRDQADRDFEELTSSIERSRKRHLSEGLVRGDLAADRLTAQELTASPLLKKHRPTMMSKEDFFSYMEKNVTKRFDTLDANNTVLRSDLTRVHDIVKKNTTRIDTAESDIVGLKQEMRAHKEQGRQVQPTWASIAAS